jgi:prepilin-type N-terminal cleavage/methylation domain-containing protein
MHTRDGIIVTPACRTPAGRTPAGRAGARAGFTLIEMMMAILLTMLVFAVTIPFFRAQTKALDGGAGRLDAAQNARFAQSAIDRELRLAGGATGQPIIVQAAPFSITFNADLVTTHTNDPDATYYNPSADSLAVESWLPARAKKLPTSNVVYPTLKYYDGNGFESHAETISYFLYLDATTGRNDLYTLFRRVNDRDSTVIAHNMWIPPDTNYFFKYSRTDSSGNIVSIPQGSLPLYWNTAGDWADSVRLVQMRIAGLYHDVQKNRDITKTIYHSTRLLNAGMLKQNTCGAAPLAPGTVTATQLDTLGHTWGGAPMPISEVKVVFNASPEETAGALDVASYVIQRTIQGTSNWQVLGNLVAYGQASYTYDDFTFQTGHWVYGVVAVDCSPSYSPVSQSSVVINP